MNTTREKNLGKQVLIALAALWLGSHAFAQVITVTVDRATTIGTSQYAPGVSQIDNSLDYPWTGNNGAAVTNARSLLAGGVHWINNHIMAWGVPDPWPDPSQPGPTVWGTLDAHIKRSVDLGASPVITLCEAPWWMKGSRRTDGSTKLIPTIAGEWDSITNNTSVTDFRGFTYTNGYVTPDPYSSRVLDNQMTNWLTLVEAVARRYMVPPYNARHFQVWNEFKGYHNPTLNRWDYENSPGDPSGYNAKHGYTYMYNQVYSRLKSVAISLGLPPESVNVGGPYLVMSSGSSSTNVGGWPSSVTGPWGVMDRRCLDGVSYWLTNKTGAEFVVCDGSNGNKFGGNITDPFTRCEKFATVNQWIHQQPGGATLPIWWAEWYSTGDGEEAPLDDFNGALGAYSALQQIKSGGGRTFLWGGELESAAKPPLWNTTGNSGGGQAYPWYYIYRDLGNYFGQGTALYSATSSSTNLAVLASAQWTLLINKLSNSVTVSVEGTITNLPAYAVVRLPASGALASPRPPAGLRAMAASAMRIDLAWVDTATNESGFEIWRAVGAGGAYALLAWAGANITNYADTAVALDTAYAYYVRATNASGASVPSTAANATTMPFALYEAELLPYIGSSGDTVTVYLDAGLSAGQGRMLDGSAINDYLTCLVAVPKAGTYNVTLRASASKDRGKFQLAIAPSLAGSYTNVGAVQDLYVNSTSMQQVLLNLGLASFNSAGNYYFQFLVVGKNASSTDYKLAFDYLMLTPYSFEGLMPARNGPFQTLLTGPALTRAIFLASTNLSNWTSITTNEPFRGSWTFDDPQAAGWSQRFYRVQLEP